MLYKFHGFLVLLSSNFLEHLKITLVEVWCCNLFKVILLSQFLSVLRPDEIRLFMRSNGMTLLLRKVNPVFSEVGNDQLGVITTRFFQVAELQEGFAHATDVDDLLESFDSVFEYRFDRLHDAKTAFHVVDLRLHALDGFHLASDFD